MSEELKIKTYEAQLALCKRKIKQQKQEAHDIGIKLDLLYRKRSLLQKLTEEEIDLINLETHDNHVVQVIK